jgi:hypothetical protein
MNIEFLIVCYFVSLFVDWIFQWDWQAQNKSKWVKGNRTNALFACVTHSLIYAFITVEIVGHLIDVNIANGLIFSVLFISHFIIDSRIPVKWIMRFKGMSKQQINDYQTYGFMHIGIDHRLHELVILILAFFVK